MTAGDVTETLILALQAAGLDQANVVHRPRLLSDNVLCREASAGFGQQVSCRRH
jgi:putative transposase